MEMFILLPTKWWVLALRMNPKGNMSFQASDDNIDSLNILSSLIIQHFQYRCLQKCSTPNTIFFAVNWTSVFFILFTFIVLVSKPRAISKAIKLAQTQQKEVSDLSPPMLFSRGKNVKCLVHSKTEESFVKSCILKSISY